MAANTLRARVRRIQQLENEAADAVGVAMLVLDESALLGKGRDAYVAEFRERTLAAIGPHVIEAARIGRELAEEVRS